MNTISKDIDCKDHENIEGFIGIDQASNLLSISKSKLYKDLRDGRIRSIRISPRGKHLFRASDLVSEVKNGQ